jgi:hypothetical protein
VEGDSEEEESRTAMFAKPRDATSALGAFHRSLATAALAQNPMHGQQKNKKKKKKKKKKVE